MLRDAYGLTVSTDSRAAVDAYDAGVRGLLGFGADAVDRFRQSVAADPDFALARAALATALLLDEQVPEARAEMERAAAAGTAQAATLGDREGRHLEALRLFMSGRGHEAIPLMKEILAAHPRDVVLMQRLYFLHFWQGRSADMLECTSAVLSALADDGYALGYHAFALEENRRFEEALPLAERALERNERDAWAVHAIAHIRYERGENRLGIESLPPRIHPCDHLGYFRNHLLWHLALLHLAEGDYERGGRLFASVFGRIPITIASDLQDSVALAWRLDLFGHPEPGRWKHLAAAARRWVDVPLLLFHDLHVGMALSAAGEWATAEQHLEWLRARGRKARHPTLPEVVVPVLEGLHAFARGDFAACVAAIEPVESRIVEVGGSHAQREVFHDTLLAAALRGARGRAAGAPSGQAPQPRPLLGTVARVINWQALAEETVELLRRYLTLDTTNPPGNETLGARFLEEALAQEGIASETMESAPGRGNLVARLRGDGSEGGIVLHHHIDVVYADRRYWTVDPFGGVIRDGFLYGRGALDMKSTGILHLAGVLAIKRARVPLKRDLILLATADEEAGSRFGAQFVADRRRDWLAGAEYALSEMGGIYPAADQRGSFGSIVTSEKTGLPLRLTARSEPGHGSMPWPDTAPNRLVRALGRLLAAERPPRVLPEVAEYFAKLGSVMAEPAGSGYDDLERALADADFRRTFLSRRQHAAMLRTTFAVTMLKGSEKRNVIPPEAVAEIDCRLLRGDDPAEIVGWVREAIADERVEVSLVNPPPKIPNASPPDTPLYKALGQALGRRAPGVVVAPDILVGFTDNWVFRNCGLHGYGFSPFVLGEEEWRRVHGNDERISIENLHEGVRCHTEMLLDVAAA